MVWLDDCKKELSDHGLQIHTLGARDFSSTVSGFCEVFIAASPLVASAYGQRRVGLRPTPKIPTAREKNLWYPGYQIHGSFQSCPTNAPNNQNKSD